jgi:hypothetical protein
MEKKKTAKIKKQKKHISIDVSYDGDEKSPKNKTKKAVWHENICCSSNKSDCTGFSYILGVIGASVYYITAATGFWQGVLGFLKALVWPAFLVYELLKFLGN